MKNKRATNWIVGLLLLIVAAGALIGTAYVLGRETAPTVSQSGTEEHEPRTRQMRLVVWNVESGGNDPTVIAKQMEDFSDCDVVALNEVHSENVAKYVAAIGDHYQAIVSQTGRADRLAILFDSERFELLQSEEMARHRGIELNDGNHRSPITARLQEKETGFEFVLMTCHLARRNKQLRKQQAAGLREWARDTSAPIFAIGDFNFDYSFENESGNDSFDEFMRDGVWKWIQPNPLVDSNWSDNDGDGIDNYPNSMLDFAFVANGAKGFGNTCRIIVRQGDFPDDKATIGHQN